MGFLDALINCSSRFQNALMPTGYENRPVRWIIDLAVASNLVSIVDRGNEAHELCVPMRADRSGTPSQSNLKPGLLVDNAAYALGLDNNEVSDLVFDGFVSLHNAIGPLSNVEHAKSIEKIQAFLRRKRIYRQQRIAKAQNKPKAGDLVAYRCGNVFQHDLPWAQEFWKNYLESELCERQTTPCALCGKDRQPLRILPFKLKLFGQSCPITSVNTDQQTSFGSRENEQLENSPVCFNCISTAHRVLQHLIQLRDATVGQHAVVIARDDSPTKSQPLRNQLAVFWTKLVPSGAMANDVDGEDQSITGPEAATLITLSSQNFSEDGPPPEDAQMRAVLQTPWTGNAGPGVQTDAFYFAVLSPNKTRLVVREWMELGVETVRESVSRYVAATRIIHPDGIGIWFPPLPALLDAFHPPKSDKSNDNGRRANDPHLLRQLLRCAFRDETPPLALMSRAVRRFAIPERDTNDKNQQKQQALRRMNLASALKLCLTHGASRMEQEAMEQLDDRRLKQPYLCGRLLAVLDDVQRQYHWPNKVNTTLADRFYGAASTAPASVFANLLNIATKAHLPKLRRDGRDFIANKVEEVCAALDEAGGFPSPLAAKDQAEFGLGYYHQRASFAADRRAAGLEKKRKAAAKLQGETNE